MESRHLSPSAVTAPTWLPNPASYSLGGNQDSAKYQRLGLGSHIAVLLNTTILSFSRGGLVVDQTGMPGTVSYHARECSGYTYTHLSSSTWSCKVDIVTDITAACLSAGSALCLEKRMEEVMSNGVIIIMLINFYRAHI